LSESSNVHTGRRDDLTGTQMIIWHVICAIYPGFMTYLSTVSLLNNMKRNLTILFLILLLTGCEKITEHDRTVLFEIQYINWAWGYQHSGSIIDAAGNVREFNLPSTWNFPDSEGYISEAGMEENLEQLGEKSCTVSKVEMEKYSDKLIHAQAGKLTTPEHQMCDFGSVSYSGYIYEPGNHRYRYVLIRQTGDFYVENKSSEASDIFEWLTRPCDNNHNINLR